MWHSAQASANPPSANVFTPGASASDKTIAKVRKAAAG
jgi:hypothetical protein